MTDARDAPVPYRVAYSERVRDSLRELVDKARRHGLESRVLDALREIDHRLHLYPQFGEPLSDLKHESGQVWIGTVSPLVVRYAVYEPKRLVMVAVPIVSIPGSGL